MLVNDCLNEVIALYVAIKSLQLSFSVHVYNL
jgi:hypothetical protein